MIDSLCLNAAEGEIFFTLFIVWMPTINNVIGTEVVSLVSEV